MKTPFSLLILLLTFIPFSHGQDSALSSAIEKLPPCALQCLVTSIGQSTCELTDQRCICGDAKLQSGVEACVLKSCTIKEGLTTKNLTTTLCNAPIRDKSALFKRINITLGTLSSVFVLIRLMYKSLVTISELGMDDYFILITLLSGIPSTIISDRGTLQNGLGKDIWTLEFWQITNFVRYFYVMEVLYFAQVTLLKMSLLFFYQRIFPGIGVRRVIWATITFNVLFGLIFVFVAIFQCRPISYYWTSWDGEHTGTCININALGWSNAVISIVLDIWMLAIPLSQLVHLKLAWKKKVGVAMMFCVGTFVTVVSILRLQSLVHFAKSQNPTWDQWDVNNWSTVEINVGIICACMPAIRVVLVRIFPRVLGSTRGTSNQYYAKYGSRSGATPGLAGGGHSGVVGGGFSGMGSKGGAGANTLVRDKNVITFTKTFEVQHGDKDGNLDRDGDEIGLVELDGLSGKGSRGAKSGVGSGSSSQVSL